MHFIIQTIISLIVIYIVSSIINSLIVEFFAQWFNMRGNFLRYHLINFFRVEKPPKLSAFGRLVLWFKKKFDRKGIYDEITNFGELFYDHFIIKNFSKKRKEYPGYIDKKLFSNTLYDLLLKDIDPEKYKVTEPDDIEIDDNIDLEFQVKLSKPVKQIISNILKKSAHYEKKLDQVADEIEDLYETYMDRISEWYKRRMKRILFVSGLLIAMVSNLDSFNLFTAFKNDSQLRNEYYAIAQQVGQLESIELQDSVKQQLTQKLLKKVIKKEDTLLVIDPALVDSVTIGTVLEIVLPAGLQKISHTNELPLGWRKDVADLKPSRFYNADHFMNGYFEMLRAWLVKLIGLCITGVALSFGATFWFDLLKKLLHFG